MLEFIGKMVDWPSASSVDVKGDCVGHARWFERDADNGESRARPAVVVESASGSVFDAVVYIGDACDVNVVELCRHVRSDFFLDLGV